MEIHFINQVALTERYSALQRPMNIRKQRLLDSLQVQQLFRDIEDEEAWIREKEPVAASTNRGKINSSVCSIYFCSH
jgi:spectrin alpha